MVYDVSSRLKAFSDASLPQASFVSLRTTSAFLETMDVVIKVFQYLVKQPVKISKIFRVGKHKHFSNVAVSTVESPEDILKDRVCPNPVIVHFGTRD